MNHAPGAGAAELRPDTGWILHSGGRQFGPLSDDELRRYFSSGMVKHGDTLTLPGLSTPMTAHEVALQLQVPAPMPSTGAAAAAPLPPPVRHLTMAPANPSGQRALVLLGIALVLGAVYWWMPKPRLQQQSASAPGDRMHGR